MKIGSNSTLAQTSVCVLMTCFNRRAKTLECLSALQRSEGVGHVELRCVLVDDGSTDGTTQTVRDEFGWVEVVRSDGNLYWCRGMHRAFDIAMRRGFDYYLWLNDDTVMRPQALSRLLACEAELRLSVDDPVIVIGNTVDPSSGAHTYGGERRPSRLAPLRVQPVAPSLVAQPCDSMSGNIVLVPARAARRVGNLDPAFEHAMGDTDYALRARRVGVQLWAAPGVHGTCAHNPVDGTYLDASLPLVTRWRRMLHRKGLPWRSWMTFTRRHTGVMWPMYFAWPYIKLAMLGGLARSRDRRGSSKV